MKTLEARERSVLYWLVRDELACWVRACFLRELGALRLQRLILPLRRSINSYEAFMAWYLDTERCLFRVPLIDRRILLLNALGHSQLCIAGYMGVSLRTMVRCNAEALEHLLAVELAGFDTSRGDERDRSPQWHQVRAALLEPHCDCRFHHSGHPPKKRIAA